MQRVAVFGNTGGGKSTLARRLAEATRLPLVQLDLVQYRPGGGAIAPEDFSAAHAALLRQDRWIIEGFGSAEASLARFAVADTLVFVDLPLLRHAWWVTKRLLMAPFRAPEGWPPGSPLVASTLNSYRVLWHYRRRLTPQYRVLASEMAATKRVHHLRSRAEMAAFLVAVAREQRQSTS